MPRALITGITGQDGSYLAEFLLDKGYEVHGIARNSPNDFSSEVQTYLVPLWEKISPHHCSDLTNPIEIKKIVEEVHPDECYHLAASSFAGHPLTYRPELMNINFNSTFCLLSTLKECAPNCRFYFAGSSEIFGLPTSSPQKENSDFQPKNTYGISKLASHHLVRNFRDQEDMYACTGFAFNHESIRRDRRFLTRKISSSVALIKKGLQESLELGNMNATRDWGYAPEYVEAMWLMLQGPSAEDFVIASGTSKRVRDLLDVAFSHVGLRYEDYCSENPEFYRASEPIPLVGDASLIREKTSWEANTSIEDVMREMVDHDLSLLEN